MKRISPLRAAVLCLLLLDGCSLFGDATPPFPENTSDDAAAVDRATWTAPKAIVWDEPDPRGIVAPVSMPAPWVEAAAPSSLDGWTPFASAPAEESFIIDQTPLDVCDLRTLPVLTVTFTTALLGLPERALAAAPRSSPDANCGLLVFGTEERLSGASLRQMLHDRYGRLWIAGNEGLRMYDGAAVFTYAEAQGLASSAITSLVEDEAGRIWIGHKERGLDVIDPLHGTISHADARHGLPDERIASITRDNAGRLLLCTPGGLTILDAKRGRAQQITASQAKGFAWNSPGAYVAAAADGDLWVTHEQGVSIVSPGTGLLSQLRLKSGLPVPASTGALRASDGTIWIGTRNGVDGYNTTSHRVTHLAAAQGFTSAPIALAQSRGVIWAASANAGVTAFDIAEMRSLRIDHATGLSDNSVLALLADVRGGLWIGTASNALCMLPPSGLKWAQLRMDQNAQARGITSVYADGPHRICIGSESALLLVDLESGRRRTLPKAVTHALRAASGELWLSTPNGVLVLDSALGSMRAITRKQGLRGVNSTCCLQLRDGSILVASLDGGLTLSDPAFTHPRRLGMEQGLSAEAVLTLCETRKGSVLIGTSGGLDEFNPANGTLRHATLGGMRPQAAIAALSQDDAGRIWIGSEGEGVAVLDHEKDILLRYTSASGLPSMHVASFVQRGGVMYCGTSNGLAQFTPLGSGFAVGSIGSAQGLSRLVFARQAAAVAGDGSAYWGAGDAVLRSASAATPDTGAPQVFVSGLDIKDRRESFLTARWLQRVLADTAQSIRRNAAAGKDATSIVRSTLRDEGASWVGVEGPYCLPTELCLAAGQGQLTFHFTGGSAAGGRTRYRYLLEGNDAAWSASSERTQAEYRNLAPGSYVFVVRCQSADGRWSAPARFAFVIAAPFWRSWWAYALYALLLAALIVAGIREQKRRLFRRELAGSRLRETELRSTLLQTENERNEALLDKEKEATEASQTLRELREQQELYTQRFWTGLLAQLDSGEGDAPLADLNVLLAETAEAEAQYIRSALPDFQCALHTDFASALPPLPIARQDLARAVSALLRNAYEAVHEKRLAQGADSGYAPGIGLRTSLQDGRVEILVSDNGPGIPEPLRELIFEPCFTSKGGGTHGGLGLALARHLVAAQGGSITLRSRSGVGTEFVISLPV